VAQPGGLTLGFALHLVEKNENENENRLFGMAAMHAGFT